MAKKIQDLRDTLFDSIEQVKSGKMDIDKAKTVANLAQAIINSARVEVEYLRSINATASTGFIEPGKRITNA